VTSRRDEGSSRPLLRALFCSLAAALLLAALSSGCDTFGDRSARRDEKRGHLDLTLVNRCARPAELCYAADACVTLNDARPQKVRAQASGGQVLVTLKGTERSALADETFAQIEIDETCGRLERKLAPRRESTAAMAGGPSQ
jgi:hypothetical protein